MKISTSVKVVVITHVVHHDLTFSVDHKNRVKLIKDKTPQSVVDMFDNVSVLRAYKERVRLEVKQANCHRSHEIVKAH